MPKYDKLLPLFGSKPIGWESIFPIYAGLILEFGVAGGGSLTHLCKLFPKRLCYGFDWFHGLPNAWHGSDCGSHSQRGIAPSTAPNGCLIVGKVEDTAKGFMKAANQKVALAHMDLDLGDPTRVALDAMSDYVQPGTILIFDEINQEKSREHEQRAFFQWLESIRFDAEYVGNLHHFSVAFRLVENSARPG